MNDIIDEDLLPKKEARPNKSPYHRWSNIAAFVVLVGALFFIMHYPYGDILVVIGASAHIGIELGFFAILRGASQSNNRRLIGAAFTAFVLYRLRMRTELDLVDIETFKWYLAAGVLLTAFAATYRVTRNKIRSLRS
jgi:hypothetical protein